MNLAQAKAKLNSVSKSTATKHPKVLVSELCAVVKFLLDEVDRIKTPILSVLPKRLPEDLVFRPQRRQPPEEGPPQSTPSPEPSRIPYDPDLKRERRGNAGDAT
ncbi:hypothetical protein LCGC14_0426560 [marine sediment metagenome]|uniref:Uncharacterized protein n=1 Tax=marine sediment metagenome TaxID=412755 RepID=A0A0F9VYS7_9ZZZZ